MDTTLLVEAHYEVGKTLIEKLDEQGYIYPIALWMDMPEHSGWGLVFGIPKLHTKGITKKTHREIYNTIMVNNIDLSLGDIYLMDMQDQLMRDLKSVVKTGPGIGKKFFFGRYIDLRDFPNSIIYRVNC